MEYSIYYSVLNVDDDEFSCLANASNIYALNEKN